MKTTLTSLPGMYADWSTLGWSMILGRPPTGAGMAPTVTPAKVTPVKDWEDEGGSLKPTKKARAKPAAKKAKSKTAGKRALKSKARNVATAKKRRASTKRH